MLIQADTAAELALEAGQATQVDDGMSWQVLLEMLIPYGIAVVVLGGFALLCWLLLHFFVYRRFVTYPATLKQGKPRQFLEGLIYGVAAVALVVLPIWVLQGFSQGAGWVAYSYDNETMRTLLMWSFFALQSLTEELTFRAVGMVMLGVLIFWLTSWVLNPQRGPAEWALPGPQRTLKFVWLYAGLVANLVVSGSFAWVHHNNPHATTLSSLNVGFAGLVLGQLFWMQGRVFGAWSWHWVWNALIASFGLPVSGYALAPALAGIGFGGAREGILSGGPFGPEGSIFTSIVLLLSFGWLFWQALKGIEASGAEQHSSPPDVAVPTAPDQVVEDQP